MDDFYFSLWVFDPNFIPSVIIMAVSLFVISTVFTKIVTGGRVSNLVNGPDPDETRQKAYNRLLMTSMQEELDRVRGDKKYSELDESEKEALRDIRQQYFDQLKGECHGNRKQLKG